MTPTEVVAVVTALVALGARELLMGAWNYITGRAGRETGRMREVLAERDAAEAERDMEADWRRRIQEHCSMLRFMLIEKGVRPDLLPVVPARPGADRPADRP